jgi:hypothetical protein
MWDTAKVIGVPYGVRLTAIVLVDNETHIWTATKRRHAEYKKWRGTFFRIESSGRVTRVTIDESIVDGEMEFLIKEADK